MKLSILRSIVVIGLVTTSLIAASAHAAPFRSLVRDSTYRLGSDYGPDTLRVRELEFAYPVLAAVVDTSQGVLVVGIGERVEDPSAFVKTERIENRVLAVDLRSGVVLWDEQKERFPLDARANRVLLSRGDRHIDMVRLDDGRKVAGVEGQAFLWNDGVCLRVTDGDLHRWNLEDGRDVWGSAREVTGDADDVIRADSVAYLIAEGIEKFDLRTGGLWSFSIPASRSGLYSVPGEGTTHMRSLYGGSRAKNLTARPLIDATDVYFAADTTVVRLDARTGAVRWRRSLARPRSFSLKQRAMGGASTPEFLGHLLIRDAGTSVAVASMGWASAPSQNALIADPPSLAMLAKRDGAMIARTQISGVQFLNDVWITDRGRYVLASDRILGMDDSLQVRATFRAASELKPLGSFIHAGQAIVVTTGNGLVALSADSLRIVWSHKCGRMLALQPEIDGFRARYAITTQGIIRLDDLARQRPSAYYPLRSNWAEFSKGVVLMGAGRTLRIVGLPHPSPPQRVD